ncbi:hypothetical protein JKP88DRAFT_270402 [Tribonema minus]|uniref:DUF4419 domain-containing protein n=1 Tax=Tribonema minus TaxID=303371 RepID=A0A835YPQ9_9STRA|nr:hypothetical protein JKP88DRAFT_270402 [Tribonema minus]
MTKSNGFVDTIVHAYNEHHHLIIRPDDVWSAITIQFSYYVNLHAEKLRPIFVDFQGKKELVVDGFGSLFTADYAALATLMSGEIAKNIKDPSIREWVLPGFTTTTDHDKVVGSVVLMAAMQKYFSFKMRLSCGLPSVTLLGELSDWQEIEARAKRLADFDAGDGLMAEWSGLLAPILEQFTLSAQGKPSTDFWSKVCHRIGGASGPTYLSGWVTAFAVFNEKGKWVGRSEASLGSYLFKDRWADAAPAATNTTDGPAEQQPEWPFVDTSHIPSGTVSVPVTVDDHGTEYKTTLTAGHFGCTIVDGTGLQPALHWRLVLATDKPEVAAK